MAKIKIVKKNDEYTKEYEIDDIFEVEEKYGRDCRRSGF